MDAKQTLRKITDLERRVRTLEFRLARQESYKSLDLITEREAAEISGFTIRTLKAWRLTNLMPAQIYTRVNNGRNVRYHRQPFLDWMLSDERLQAQ